MNGFTMEVGGDFSILGQSNKKSNKPRRDNRYQPFSFDD